MVLKETVENKFKIGGNSVLILLLSFNTGKYMV